MGQIILGRRRSREREEAEEEEGEEVSKRRGLKHCLNYVTRVKIDFVHFLFA